MPLQLIPFRCAPRDAAPPPQTSSKDDLRISLAEVPVLIVEDEGMIAWMLESLLEDMGFRSIAIAPDRAAALQEAALQLPGLIVSDINLGAGQDGIDVVAAIRRLGGGAVVFVSGYAGPEALRRIRSEIAGAAVLSKPVEAAALDRAVFDALAYQALN